MAALVFPPSPSTGTRWPADPGTSGVSQYEYDGSKWNVVTPLVSLGTANQGAYNTYQWPAADGLPGQQLTTDGAGNLIWDVSSAPTIQILGLLEPFDGTRVAFTLVEASTTNPFIPDPPENLILFLGGVPQLPNAAYSVSTGTSTITFTEAPKAGTTFYAISNVVA